MTKELNKTIRSLNDSLTILNLVNDDIIDEYVFDGKDGMDLIKESIQFILNQLEEKYQELHKMGAHNE